MHTAKAKDRRFADICQSKMNLPREGSARKALATYLQLKVDVRRERLRDRVEPQANHPDLPI
jgi:hypothetical protein